ncbi:MAG: ATP-binding protein [Verrucomicrobia bacterium]|nr:ATP-binding protein [Deltaproteobacteria bacterium]
MQTHTYDTDQAAQVISFQPVRAEQHEICLSPFTDNLDHLMALELESKWMLAVAFLRRGANKQSAEDNIETSCHPLSAFTIGVDLKQAEMNLSQTTNNNRRREELSLQKGVSLRFIEFCHTWQLDNFERSVVMLLLMQYAAPDFIAMYKESGLERYSYNGMEIGGLLALTSPDLRSQLANRRYFSVNATLLKKRVVLAGAVDSTTNILGLSIYLHESNVCFLLGDNNHYHIAFSFIRQERSNVKLEQIVLPEKLKRDVTISVERYLAGRQNGTLEELDTFFGYGTGLALLFHGPSGTGKTMLAKGLANQFDCPLLSLNLDDIKEIKMSDEDILSFLFREAALLGAIVFLDECDDLFSGSSNSCLSRSLLLEMEKSRCITILATNRPVELDPAMERRLAMKVHFTLPDATLRLQMWKALMPGSVQFAPDVDLSELAGRYQFTGGLIRNSIFLAITTATRGDDDRPILTAALLHSAAEKQAATLADESGLCQMYSPTMTMDTLPLRSRQRAELKNLSDVWKSLNSRQLGLSLLISSSDIAAGVQTVEGFANVCGLKVRSFDYRRVISLMDSDRITDPVTQRKILPMDYAFSPTACDASLILFVDHDGYMQQKLDDKKDVSLDLLMRDLVARLRSHNGLFCMVTKEIKQNHIPQEFNLHMDLEYPPEERQIRQWEEMLGRGNVDDDELVKLVETHPMHISQIDVIARQAEIRATIKGKVTGKPCLTDIHEVISRYNQVKFTPLLFGSK